jgi:hypothetical protein
LGERSFFDVTTPSDAVNTTDTPTISPFLTPAAISSSAAVIGHSLRAGSRTTFADDWIVMVVSMLVMC